LTLILIDLAVIFRPGILAHQDHDLAPAENELSTHVLEFLIQHQDWFILDIPPLPQSSHISLIKSSSSTGHGQEASGSGLHVGAAVSSITKTATVLPSQAQSGSGDFYDTDVHIELSSDDEQHDREQSSSSHNSGGWKLIHRRKRRGRDKEGVGEGNSTKEDEGGTNGRSKSSDDRYRNLRRGDHSSPSTVEGLSPVNEISEDTVLGSERGASVGRSRTLPSSSSPRSGILLGSDREGGGREKWKPSKVLLKKRKDKSRPISMGLPFTPSS
jgi:GTPase-activating protein SAC7